MAEEVTAARAQRRVRHPPWPSPSQSLLQPPTDQCSTVAHSLPSVHVHLGEDDVGERVRVRALALVREGDAHGRDASKSTPFRCL